MRLNNLFSLILPMRTQFGREPARNGQLAERKIRENGAHWMGSYIERAVTSVTELRSRIQCNAGQRRLATFSSFAAHQRRTRIAAPAESNHRNKCCFTWLIQGRTI
jgi:hypothetical protein